MSQLMTLSQLKEYLPNAQWINGVASEQEIKRFISDSRQVTVGDIFIAIRGEKFDAHDFLEDVKSQGAVACIVSAVDKLPKGLLGILVKDTQQALQQLATCWKKTCDQQQLKHSVVVTGSNGKTTVKGMIQSIFNASVEIGRASCRERV